LTVTRPVAEIRVEEAVYRYPGKENPAAAGVSLMVRQGEVLALVGENGAGGPPWPGCSSGSSWHAKVPTLRSPHVENSKAPLAIGARHAGNS
jgi:hypothetical protein